jgi:hypothetical protein
MIKRRHLQLALISLLFLPGSCSPDSPASPAAPGKWVKIISRTDSDYLQYSYDSIGNIIKTFALWQPTPGGKDSIVETNYVYQNGLLKSWSNAGNRMEYNYLGNLPESIRYYSADGSLIYTVRFTIDNNKRVSELLTLFESPPANDSIKTVYSYYSSGNVKQIDVYYDPALDKPLALASTTKFENYDDKFHAEQSNENYSYYLPGFLLFKNNPLLITDTLFFSRQKSVQTNSFNYDGAGYPLTRTRQITVDNNTTPPVTLYYTY